ncbi:MAG: glycine--tRNA ligase [Planctomycetota bacterium]|jgi:glycyl-tRNA synthetase
MPAKDIEQVRNLCQRRGFIFQGSGVYGGMGSFWDYGPLGVEMLNNIKSAWWQANVYERDDMEGVDAAILMTRKVWAHSGHEATFQDPLVDCKECNARFRADQVAGEQEYLANGLANTKCPKCGAQTWTEPREFNLMFKTHVGPVAAAEGTEEEATARAYLRPETAQGIFMNFAHIQRSMARKVPFGIAQIGKSFRNEITPGNFIFRTREFEQMEIEFFIKPPAHVSDEEKTDEQWHEEWIKERHNWWLEFSTPPAAGDVEKAEITERFRLRPQTADELAHYAKATTDIEYLFPGALGWGEIEGVANRTDFDLSAHSKDVPEEDRARLHLDENADSTEKLDYFDADAKTRYIPWVIEPSAGATRAMLTFLCEAYDEEQVSDPKKQDVDQLKSDTAAIVKNADRKRQDAEKAIAKGAEPKHNPDDIRAFIASLEETRDRLPESFGEFANALNHAGAANLEPVKKFKPRVEKIVETCFRTVLRLHPKLAPVKLAVFPLKKNKKEIVEKAKEIQAMFRGRFRTVYDDSAGIGRLYRRQDEIGTPYCVTVDFESLEDDTVTVRERDTMDQVRVPIVELKQYLLERIEG